MADHLINVSARRQLYFWLAVLAVGVFLLTVLRGVLLPFLLGLALAYLLDPMVCALEKKGVGRFWSALLIAVSFFALIILLVILVGPLVLDQATELAGQLPDLIKNMRATLVEYGNLWLGDLFPSGSGGMEGAVQEMGQGLAANLTGLLKSVWTSGLALFNFLSLILITPVVTFFLLKDWDNMIARVKNWLPRDHAPIILLLAKRIDRAIDGFIRGQVIISAFIGVFYAIALQMAGLKFGLLVGVLAGLLNIIPFLGSLAGFVISTLLAMFQFWPDWTPVLIVMAIFLFGQLLDANVLTPKIIGDKIRLHPVWLIFALVVFGYLFGLVGMLLAIPIAAAIGVLMRFGLERYLDSAFYKGSRGDGARPRSAD